MSFNCIFQISSQLYHDAPFKCKAGCKLSQLGLGSALSLLHWSNGKRFPIKVHIHARIDMMQTFRNRKTRTYEDHRNTCRCMQQFWLIIVASGDSSPKIAQETKALILFFDTLPRSAHALACWEYGARPLSSWWGGIGYGRMRIVKLKNVQRWWSWKYHDHAKEGRIGLT